MVQKIFYFYYLKSAFRKHIAFSSRVQCFLQFLWTAIHNPYRDECCVDFGCCNKKDHCWLHISEKQLPIRRKVWYEPTAPIGTPNRSFIKRTKWIIGKH